MLANEGYHVDLPRLKEGNVKLLVFAIFVEENYFPAGDGLKKTLQVMDYYFQIIKECNELELVTEYSDIENIINEGKIASILAIEGAKSIFDLSALRVFHRLGIRMITLTWNHRNHLANGIGETKKNMGLTSLGEEFVKEMNKLGIVIDVSHLNNMGFWDVIKTSNKPVVASHSNAKSLCSHVRNLSDKQIKAIADSGGIIGINFCPLFLTETDKADIKDVVKHISYIKSLVGVKHIGLGTDYDGILKTPNGLEDMGKLYKLQNVLINEGYTESEIRDILFNNWLRVYKDTLS